MSEVGRLIIERDLAEIRAERLLAELIKAIESSGFALSGPTNHSVAEHREPVWVCTAREVIANLPYYPRLVVLSEKPPCFSDKSHAQTTPTLMED